ncbi:MAG: right-handed parallel beta-helix repeat-containing protein [Verrucomicrobia bacterium]|nr:right-handed parallel beta-helix repeat-containing protein [Verrucomicrobiota bacterium]
MRLPHVHSKLLVFVCATFLLTAAQAAEFHVSPGGSDDGTGGADRPFATLERARDAVRAAGQGPHQVVLSAGTYRLTQTFTLDQRDSGTTYRAAPGAEVRLCGSKSVPVSAIEPVTDSAILDRMLPEVRGAVRQIDLRALGLVDLGKIGPRGFNRPYVPAPLELVVDDEPLTLARWPNAGQPGELIGKVLDQGPRPRYGDKPTRGGVFTFTSERPLRWLKADEVWISGLFSVGWADGMVQVKSIDAEKRTFTTVQPHMYGFASGRDWNRWVASNLLEEIDVPGEFMADRASGRLYFLPPKPRQGSAPAKQRLEVTVFEEPLVAIEGATGVVLDGLIIENSRGMGVYIERGSGNRIQNGILRNLGMVAVSIGKGITPDPDYQLGFTGQPLSRALGSLQAHMYDNTTFNREAGTNQAVVNCRIYNIGAGGVSLGGGDRKALIPAGNSVEDCDIHDFNRWDRTYRGAVNINGVGNRIANCKIHEAPAVAILLHGNDHLIELNEIFRVVMDCDDMGAFYMGRDPSERGNILRWNYWHDLAPANLSFALYLDDYAGDGTTIYGNVFYKAGQSGKGHSHCIMLNNSSDVVVEHNLLIDCPKDIETTSVTEHRVDLFRKRFEAVGWQTPLWTQRYPGFADYFSGKHPRNNTISNNLVLQSSDPRLVRDSEGRFALKPGADTGIPGFPAIPFGEIGLKTPKK